MRSEAITNFVEGQPKKVTHSKCMYVCFACMYFFHACVDVHTCQFLPTQLFLLSTFIFPKFSPPPTTICVDTGHYTINWWPLIRACLRKNLKKNQREKLILNFRSILYFLSGLDFCLLKQKNYWCNISFCFKPSDSDKDQTLHLWLLFNK